MYGRWVRGEYDYAGHRTWFESLTNHSNQVWSSIGGEDNQHVLFRLLYKCTGGCVSGNGIKKLTTLDVCDNNKGGKRAYCPLGRYTMYHKFPEWEASRLRMLHAHLKQDEKDEEESDEEDSSETELGPHTKEELVALIKDSF